MVLLIFKFKRKMAAHVVRTRKKLFDTFFRRVNFISTFYQEKLVPLLSAEKPFFGDLDG